MTVYFLLSNIALPVKYIGELTAFNGGANYMIFFVALSKEQYLVFLNGAE